MTSPKRNHLELTWIGTENRPKLEPRILVEDSARSYHARHRVTSADFFDNRLASKCFPPYRKTWTRNARPS